jgi:hypothetical protein
VEFSTFEPIHWRLPLRLIVGYGLMQHGVAKILKGPDAFTGILQMIGVRFVGAAFVVLNLTEFGREAWFSPSSCHVACPMQKRFATLKKRMRRGIQISVSVIALLLLLKPFDCFSSGQFTQKAVDCCKKGKCVPSSNADDCCKGTLPGGKQLVASKAPHHSTPTLDFIASNAAGPIAPTFATIGFSRLEAPRGSPPSSRLNLPLLI